MRKTPRQPWILIPMSVVALSLDHAQAAEPILVWPAASAATSTTLTLEQATQIAYSRSPKLRALEARLEEARALSGAARSEFMPRVGVATGIEKNPSVADSSSRITYGYVSWNLFRGFADRRATQAANFDVARAELELAAEKFSLALDVEVKLFRILGTMRSMSEWEQALQLNSQALKDVRMRRGAGMASQGDSVVFEVRQSRFEAELADAKALAQLEKASLSRLVGYEIGQSLTFSGDIPRYVVSETADQIFKTAQEQAYALREAAISVAKADVEASRWVSGTLPSVDFETRHGWLPLGERPAKKPESDAPATYVLVTAKMDLFTGLSTIHERRAAIARKQQSEEELRATSLELLTNVERSLRKLVLLEQRVKSETENSEKTLKLREITAREYKSGIKTGQDYAAAIDLAIDSRRRQIDSLLAWHEERFGLETLIGRKIAVVSVGKEVK